jgi:hypothetical protein
MDPASLLLPAQPTPLIDRAAEVEAIYPWLGTRVTRLTDAGYPPLSERLRDFLRERALLLVLDNLERALPAAAVPLADLLAGCPGLALLVTSRAPLKLHDHLLAEFPFLGLPNP